MDGKSNRQDTNLYRIPVEARQGLILGHCAVPSEWVSMLGGKRNILYTDLPRDIFVASRSTIVNKPKIILYKQDFL